MNSKRFWMRAGVVAIVAGGTSLGVLGRDQLDPAALDNWISGFGLWAPLVYVLLYAAGTVVFAPGSLFALAGGAMFGPVLGTLLNLTGATIGAGLAFVIARYLAGDWVARKAGGKLKRLIEGVEKEGWRFVAFIRLVPVFPFNLSNYAFGLTRISLGTYAVTSFVTMAPGALAYTWLGYAGREALGGNAAAIRYGLLALGVLAVIAFVPRIMRRVRGDNRPGWIAPQELEDLLSTAAPVLILDVRSREEFEGPQGHIPGAINVPLDALEGRLESILRGGTAPVVTVCRTDRRSAAAARLLSAAGCGDVRVLRGGMVTWNRRGHVTARQAAA